MWVLIWDLFVVLVCLILVGVCWVYDFFGWILSFNLELVKF